MQSYYADTDYALLRAAVNVLNKAASSAQKNLWWPFTQHATVLKDRVTVIDSRCGEQFAVYQPGTAPESPARLQMQYDACASWWTQVKLCVRIELDMLLPAVFCRSAVLCE